MKRPFILVIWAAFAGAVFGQAKIDLKDLERMRTVLAAEAFLREEPVTVTAFVSTRSSGNLHEFFSEGDYWWPDPKDPQGPYIQRDGMTNPDNFVAHRLAMIRFCDQVATLASAWALNHEEVYAEHAVKHLRAWFIDENTKMYPHLNYAQAIKGRFTGRGTGIIDTVHLIEVARAAFVLSGSKSMSAADLQGVKSWFSDYLKWMTTHKYGIDEREAKNNHGTCWVMQAAAFAQLTGDEATLEYCRKRYKEVLLPNQMAADGSFPLELKRTKPYGYSLFNLDAFAGICRILSTSQDNLWKFQLPDGRGMKKGMEFLYPYMKDKSAWPFAKDVMHFDEWPVRQPCLLFAGIAFDEQKYLDLWKSLDPAPKDPEIIRNLPIRHPLLWLESSPAEVRPQEAKPASQAGMPTANGVYYRGAAGKWIKLDPAFVDASQLKGLNTYLDTEGLSGLNMTHVYLGVSAPLQLSEKRPVFYVRGAGAPRDAQIVQLTVRKKDRTVRTTSMDVSVSNKGGFKPGEIRPVTVTALPDGFYSVTPVNELKPGEYLLALGTAMVGFDFGVTPARK